MCLDEHVSERETLECDECMSAVQRYNNYFWRYYGGNLMFYTSTMCQENIFCLWMMGL